MVNVSDYDLRSLQHERRMLELYRKGSAADAGLLQPLANACWRAAAFEWRANQDAPTVRLLWDEGARALAEGFVRRRSGFARSGGQLFLALHMAISARAFDVIKSLAYVPESDLLSTNRADGQGGSRQLLSAYRSVIRVVFERDEQESGVAQRSLDESESRTNVDGRPEAIRSIAEESWEQQEQSAMNELLRAIVKVSSDFTDDGPVEDFSSLMTEALNKLDQYVETRINHAPKLYCWLPGIALSVLAQTAGLELSWVNSKASIDEKRYLRLPSKLIGHS